MLNLLLNAELLSDVSDVIEVVDEVSESVDLEQLTEMIQELLDVSKSIYYLFENLFIGLAVFIICYVLYSFMKIFLFTN